MIAAVIMAESLWGVLVDTLLLNYSTIVAQAKNLMVSGVARGVHVGCTQSMHLCTHPMHV